MDEQPLLQDKNLKSSTINRLIRDEFNFQRRTQIFLSVNTVNLVLTIYNLVSPINIEGQRSLLFYSQVGQIQEPSLNLLNLLVSLVTIHMIRLFTCILGYFSLTQKSGRLLTYFMIMSTVCVMTRGIVSLLIILNFSSIESACNLIYGQSSDGDDNIGHQMAISFVAIISIFVLIEILLSLITLIQCSRSKEDYAIASKQKEKILKNFQLCFEVAANQITQ